MRIDLEIITTIAEQAKLPRMQRECLRLFAADRSTAEIAAGLQISVSTVRQHLWRARRRIQATELHFDTPLFGDGEALKECREILDALRGPANHAPPSPKFGKTYFRGIVNGQPILTGERVAGAPPLVTAEDLVGARHKREVMATLTGALREDLG